MLKIFLKGNLRFYSIKHAAKDPIKYTSTINLPKTKFPNRLAAAKREEVQRQLVEGPFAKAYRYQEAHNREPTFVLHDGPPYANGDLHMGHAVNKILKDITIRQHAVLGQKVHYVPGWDCHGLPIELKATTSKNGVELEKPDAQSIRKKSRQYALDAITRQKADFRNWGILSDWQSVDNIYLTFQPEFITNQLQLFADLYEKGLIYRASKPVYWSPSTRTALAEAELEYDANFVSPSVYVRFALSHLPETLPALNQKVWALVWTTTPWTLPSNQAICFNAALEYALVRLQNNATSDLYLIATNLIANFENATQIKCEIAHTIAGTDLKSCSYQHPIERQQQSLPFFAAMHVQDTKGTGLVHTAPAHGPEDFLISLEHKLPVKSFVNEVGVYNQEAPEFLRGKSVLEEGDQLVLKQIASDVVSAGTFTHAYPIDWRTKKPVIIRASEQWFINTDFLKDRAVAELDKVDIYPRVNAEASRNSLVTQVRKRPYWCISRQRVWGVPIPVFYERNTGKLVTNRKLIDHICSVLRKEGNIDFWWTKSTKELLPANLLKDLNLNAEALVKGADIFDIWFDSGTTWSNVLIDSKVADLYLEGYDQFNGWFQSSLLTSVAARDCAPYKSVFVHGFTVDENGHKMSKLLGNGILPKEVTNKYGVDVLRWWVASHCTQHMAITVSDKIMQQTAESFGKIRSTLRYLNGVVGEKSMSPHLTENKNTYLNKYLLSSLVEFENEIQKCYNCYEYNRVVAKIQNFVTNQISASYVHLVKDRLYCGDQVDLENTRYTLTHCYKLLCRLLWPIAPFLVEESWSYYDADAAFHEQNVKVNAAWKNTHVEQVFNTALDIKRLVNQQSSSINSWTLAVSVACANEETLNLLQMLQPNQLNVPVSDSELCEILQVNSVTLKSPGSKTGVSVVEVKPLDVILCARCRRFAVDQDDCTCPRCTKVLNETK